MPAGSSEQPPSYPSAQIKIDSQTDSKIISVHLYGRRAEVSRIYKLNLATGQTAVTITGLPNGLDERSIRVHGRGNATIQNVTTSRDSGPRPWSTPASQTLVALTKKQEALSRELKRFESTLSGLETYLRSLRLEVVAADILMPTLDSYHDAYGKYDEKKASVQEELGQLNEEITKERSSLEAQRTSRRQCRMTATISVFTSSGGDVEILLIYAVPDASWTPFYDIRINTETKESPVELVYKAAIRQETEEDWKDAPITLATATPTTGLELPKLTPWTVSSTDRNRRRTDSPAAYSPRRRSRSRSRSRSPVRRHRAQESPCYSPRYSPRSPSPFYEVAADVTSQQGVNALFKVPGVITIPTDGREHNVTIVTLVPEAKLSWFAIPCVSEKVHITANVKNSSEYTLLSGSSNVYVDGSFVAKSNLPLVSPQESFTCPLGLDPSIRITYHPRIKQASASGLISKTSSTSFDQRITVHNTKTISVKNLKILDHIPVSQDSQISVKLITPSLTLPSPSQIKQSGSSGASIGAGPTSPGSNSSDSPSIRKQTAKIATPVKIGSGIIAQWEGADDINGSGWHLGRDGQIAWIFSGLASQQKVDLSLAWEVSAPSQVVVFGL
ncbi:hypothetical protein H1R20_g11833, partial [Candolleomyces eurysporus]